MRRKESLSQFEFSRFQSTLMLALFKAYPIGRLILGTFLWGGGGDFVASRQIKWDQIHKDNQNMNSTPQ